MCRYRYKNKLSIKHDELCTFPNFYSKHKDKFEEGLLIDKDGFCLFHSQNTKWKIDNNFQDKLFELIKVISDVHLNDPKHKWSYFFSGFHFPNYESLEFNDGYFKNAVVMSNCIFDCRVDFLDMTLNSLDIDHSLFNERVNFDNVDLINNLYSKDASFYDGLNFTNCKFEKFENHLFLENCAFYNKNKSPDCKISIKECKHVRYISLRNSLIKCKVFIKESTFDSELNFDDCIIEDEFAFEKCQVNGILSFKGSEFSLTENPNPMMSGTHFSFIELSEKGKIVFKGKSPDAEMMKNELSLHFKAKPKGLISFENFNLNRLYPKFKITIPELEKEGIVEIGKGCRKYYCTTDIITIEASNSAQKLILDIVTVFCNYFEIQQGYNLGIEIIETTKSQIRYFYFTDEIITKEDFINKIKQNENDLWQTFSKLTQKSSEAISGNNIEVKNCLIDIAALFLKIGNQLEHNNLSEQEFNNVFKSISGKSKSIIDTQSLLAELQKGIRNFDQTAPILIIEKMGNTYTNYGNVEQFGENNYKTNITDNSNVSEKERKLIFELIDKIKEESEPEKKESKLKKFIQEYGPMIGETAVKMISSAVS